MAIQKYFSNENMDRRKQVVYPASLDLYFKKRVHEKCYKVYRQCTEKLSNTEKEKGREE